MQGTDEITLPSCMCFSGFPCIIISLVTASTLDPVDHRAAATWLKLTQCHTDRQETCPFHLSSLSVLVM